jgi:hypothetical protein
MTRRIALAAMIVMLGLLGLTASHATPTTDAVSVAAAPSGATLELKGACSTEPALLPHPVLTCSQVTCTTSPICKQVCGADYICALLPGGLSGHCIAH